MIKRIKQKDRGFTLMETLVAIFILLLAITGPMAFSQNGLRASFQARDQVTAFFLAQDAIEYIKNVRDSNIINGDDWRTGLDVCILDDNPNKKGCSVDTFNGDEIQCQSNSVQGDIGCLGEDEDGSGDVKLQLNNEGYFVNDNTGNESNYARSVYLSELSEDEIEIAVKVRWTSHDTIGVREITVVEYMYDWGSIILGNDND